MQARGIIPEDNGRLAAHTPCYTYQTPMGNVICIHSWGRLGLAKVIYREARTRAPDRSSWTLLAEDEEKEKYV